RDHLDQVIATFGIILFLDEGVKFVWGAAPLNLPMPELLSGSIALMPGMLYPVWRIVVIASGLVAAAGLYALVHWTPVRLLVPAGAPNPTMVAALGVDIRRPLMVGVGFGR